VRRQRFGEAVLSARAKVEDSRYTTSIQHSFRGDGLMEASGRERELARRAGNGPTYRSREKYGSRFKRPAENLPHSVVSRFDTGTHARSDQPKRQIVDGQPQNEEPGERLQQQREMTQSNATQ